MKSTLSNWFLRHHGTVMNIACAHAPSPDTINDIFQASFVEFMHETEDFSDENAGDEPLLLRTLQQVTRRVAQRIWREHHRHTPEVLRKINDKIVELTKSREDAIFFDEKYAALRTCIESLPEKSRTLIEQRYLMENPVTLISRQFNVSPRAVFQAISRIRIILRDCVSKKLEGDYYA